MTNFTNFLKTPLAHRGLHNQQFAENSLGAFQNAVAAGYGIELDVHLIKDGSLVVVHDNNLKRVTGKDGLVENLTAEELKEYPLLIGGELIPSFDAVLALVNGKVPLLIELKVENDFNPKLVDLVMKSLEKYPFLENTAVQSFNPYAIKYIRAQYPNRFPYGQLISKDLPGQSKMVHFVFKTLLVNKISHPDFVSYDINFLPFWRIRRLRKKGMPILSWTINSEEKLQKGRKYSDNIIFETIKL
ncbi:MAG TPA: glycerophosphodiester phosphodiesterase family protein [Bacilli bacterium]|nr:glycerophosphodiester phosphodiesterase family protein [Bacilli bacterium]